MTEPQCEHPGCAVTRPKSGGAMRFQCLQCGAVWYSYTYNRPKPGTLVEVPDEFK